MYFEFDDFVNETARSLGLYRVRTNNTTSIFVLQMAMTSVFRSRIFPLGLAAASAAGLTFSFGSQIQDQNIAYVSYVLTLIEAHNCRFSDWLDPTNAQADATKPPTGALNPNEFQEFKLIKKDKLTHDTTLFRWVSRWIGAWPGSRSLLKER